MSCQMHRNSPTHMRTYENRNKRDKTDYTFIFNYDYYFWVFLGFRCCTKSERHR